jgi:hypothetical protein
VVPFIVNFADGVSAIIRVYETDLRSGDHVVRIIARAARGWAASKGKDRRNFQIQVP